VIDEGNLRIRRDPKRNLKNLSFRRKKDDKKELPLENIFLY